jgi:hypothetical protein
MGTRASKGSQKGWQPSPGIVAVMSALHKAVQPWCTWLLNPSHHHSVVRAAVEEGGERRVSKAGYDVTPLTAAKQKELAASLTPHERCI